MATPTARVIRINLSLSLANLCNRASRLPAFVTQKFPRGFLPGALGLIACAGLALFSANASAVTASVGATPGAFAVNPSGAATYSIPIAMAPGTNGKKPEKTGSERNFL